MSNHIAGTNANHDNLGTTEAPHTITQVSGPGKEQPTKASKRNGDDMDLLDELWEASSAAISLAADKNEKSSKSAGAGASGNGSVGGGSKAMAKAASGVSPAKKNSRKATFEISKSEAVVLSGAQLLRSLTHPDTYTSVTEKAVQTIIDKLDARLKGPLVALYSEDYNPANPASPGGSDNPGMKVLEELRSAVSQVRAVQPLVQAINAKPGSNLGSGEALIQAWPVNILALMN